MWWSALILQYACSICSFTEISLKHENLKKKNAKNGAKEQKRDREQQKQIKQIKKLEWENKLFPAK